jgi:hypothetical protein
MRLGSYILFGIVLLTWKGTPVDAQGAQRPADPAMRFNESGHLKLDGRSVPFLIRRLPVNSFPQLPAEIAAELIARGCMVPQTYEAQRPENVIHASLERAGSSDWAVLCSVDGRVSLLVFFGSDPQEPIELASAVELARLQAHGASNVLGFNWGIDPATPDQVQEGESGSELRPWTLDHDAISDSVIEHKTVYHYFAKGKWTLLEANEQVQ